MYWFCLNELVLGHIIGNEMCLIITVNPNYGYREIPILCQSNLWFLRKYVTICLLSHFSVVVDGFSLNSDQN